MSDKERSSGQSVELEKKLASVIHSRKIVCQKSDSSLGRVDGQSL